MVNRTSASMARPGAHAVLSDAFAVWQCLWAWPSHLSFLKVPMLQDSHELVASAIAEGTRCLEDALPGATS